MRPDLIIFDLDGTLADTLPDIAAALDAGLRAAGLPPQAPAQVQRMVGAGTAALVARAVPPGTGPALQTRVVSALLDHYRTHPVERTRLYPGVAELLAAPRPAMAVATNKRGEVARQVMAGLGVAGRFACVLGEDDVGARKPDPALVHAVLARTGVPAARAVLVGDSAIDIETARAAGVTGVAVGWGYGDPQELRRSYPDQWADSPADLALLLGIG